MAVTINGSAGVTTNVGAVYNGIQASTAVASTSGTSIDFTGIPSWVKRITVMFNGVSTSGTSNYQVQIGSGSVDTTGYACSGTLMVNATPTSFGNVTTGFIVNTAGIATSFMCGTLTLTSVGSNIWVGVAVLTDNSSARCFYSAGNKTLGGALDRVRITTVNGTDTFDAGSINILYE